MQGCCSRGRIRGLSLPEPKQGLCGPTPPPQPLIQIENLEQGRCIGGKTLTLPGGPQSVGGPEVSIDEALWFCLC